MIRDPQLQTQQFHLRYALMSDVWMDNQQAQQLLMLWSVLTLLNDCLGLGNPVCRQCISLQPHFFVFLFHLTQFAINQSMYLDVFFEKHVFGFLHFTLEFQSKILKVMLVPKGAGLMHAVQQFH